MFAHCRRKQVFEPLRIAPNSFGFTVLLGLFAALPALSVDISAPTLARLPGELGTSSAVAGLTLSLFMGGLAMGQATSGNLSDRQGRRPVLLAGLIFFAVAGTVCALSVSGPMLAAARLVQGVGAGTCSVMAYAMVQDLFEGAAARAKMSYVTMIFGAIPIFAPALGAVLTDMFGWRSVHTVLAVAGALTLIVTWTSLPESRTPRSEMPLPIAGNDTQPLWRDATFVRVVLANAFSYAAIFVYIAGSPVVIMRHMGFSSMIFAAVFACTATALMAGAWTSGYLSRRGAHARTLIAPSLAAAAGATIALAVASLAGIASAALLLPLMMAVLFTRGIIAPNLQQLAIGLHRSRAGAASAAVGVSQLLAGVVASGVVAFLIPSFGLIAVTVPMALLTVASPLLWIRASRE